MNAVIYSPIRGKRINGTLFYCFEYFAFLKQYVPNLKYFLLDATSADIEWYKGVFKEKYSFDASILDDIQSVTRTEFATLPVENLLVLDVQTYKRITHFTSRVKQVRAYSDERHGFLNKKPNHTFYGWYDNYQEFNVRTRLKFFVDIHNRYEHHGDKTFVSNLNGNKDQIIIELKLNPREVYVKELNKHHSGMFAHINKVIYYHTGFTDTNNRIIVESFIHEVPVVLHLRGYTHDSIKERYDTLVRDGLEPFILTTKDPLIQSFIEDCK